MAFLNAQNTDARYATFYDVRGNQHNELHLNCKISSLRRNVVLTHNTYLSAKDALLEKLKPADMDGSRRTGCLENTRNDVLTLVIDWASNPTSTQKALWLHGPAGSGKSTISTTLADRFRRAKQLGAFLFFDRDVTERSNPAVVARTLAYQLSSFYPQIGNLIMTAIQSSPQILISPIPSQFQELLVEPLSCIESLDTDSKIVLVLDALDECGTKQDRKALLEVLAEKSAHLPTSFRLVITSRTDLDIRLAFESQPHILTLELDLTSTASHNDILTYFRYHMNTVQKKKSYLGTDWPGKEKIRALARRASGLFVWASIACNFIDAHDPQKRLDIVLQGNTVSTAEAALDALYRIALEHAGVWDDEDFVTDFRVIIGMMLVLRNPLDSTGIDKLLANPDGRPSIETIESLRCVLSSNATVRFIHPSLADFLTNRSRCGRDVWFFTPAAHERSLAILCLCRLDQALHRGMSQSTHLADKDDNALPQDVTYACMFWVDHICMIKDDLPPIQKLLKTFISQHVLHWFETMSLLKKFSLTITLLDRLAKWIQSHHFHGRRDLLDVVRYWWRFSAEYETYIQEDPMQVYSEERLREFQVIDVQEPLISRPPTPSIFDLVSSSPSDVPSQSCFNSIPPPPTSSRLPDTPEQMSPVSRPASSDFTRLGRRASRTSLNLSSSRNSSSSPISRLTPPYVHNSLESTSPSSRAELSNYPNRQRSSSSLSLLSRQTSINSPHVSQPAFSAHTYNVLKSAPIQSNSGGGSRKDHTPSPFRSIRSSRSSSLSQSDSTENVHLHRNFNLRSAGYHTPQTGQAVRSLQGPTQMYLATKFGKLDRVIDSGAGSTVRQEETGRDEEETMRKRLEEALRKRLEEALKRREEQFKRREEELEKREEAAKKLEESRAEEARRRRAEALRMVEEVWGKEEAAMRKEKEVWRKDADARRKEEEVRRKEAESSATSSASRGPPPGGSPTKSTSARSGPPADSAEPSAFNRNVSKLGWARRQAELLKEQQERFRREQERLERERQAKASAGVRVPTKEEVIQLFSTHEKMWGIVAGGDNLRWDSFPWPVLRWVGGIGELTEGAIGAYVGSPWYPEGDGGGGKGVGMKERIKKHIRRWHPDRFEMRVLPRVVERERAVVKEGADVVVRSLANLLNAPRRDVLS
jgi:NACHT domain